MSRVIFPLLGPFLVIVFALPACALAVKVVLIALGRFAPRTSPSWPSELQYGMIVASSTVPLAWFLSAGLHQAESGERLIICAVHCASADKDFEAVGFLVVLLALIVSLALPVILRGRGHARVLAADWDAADQFRRIERLLRDRPALHALRGLLVVGDTSETPIVTEGLVSPRVRIRSSFARGLDDEALCAALHHELEHLRGRDSLRYFLARVALAVNPMGQVLLRDELARWVLARELQCDRAAVVSGASATALAQALVSAARPPSHEHQSALGSAKAETIRLRVGLLLAYADQHPLVEAPPSSLRPSLGVMGLVLMLPHHVGTLPLDTIHRASERAVALLVGD